jgi:AraC-like DNA-binding protein
MQIDEMAKGMHNLTRSPFFPPVLPTKNTFFRYLPISLADKAWGLFVPTAGYSWTPAHSPDYPLEQHPSAYHFQWQKGRILQEFQLLYIIRGNGVFESAATGPLPIKAGDAFILFPGEWHRYAPDPETGWDEYWIGFDGDVPRHLVQQNILSPKTPVFSPGLGGSWHELFTRAIEALELESVGYHQILAGLTFEMLARLHALGRVEELGASHDNSIVRKTKYLIMERLKEKIDWDALARDLHVSYSSLRHAFQQHTGFSLYQYQLQLRLNKAKSLLNTTPQSVKEIAQQIGFDCPYHFSTLFKRKTGLSPVAWRHDAHGGGRAATKDNFLSIRQAT